MRKLMVQAACVVALVPVSIAAPAGPAMASSADPCAGLTHCTEAPPIDITGDGKPDRLAYRFVNRPTDEPWNARAKVDVIVVSATGQRYTYAYRAEGLLAGTYGAAPLDGVPGAEIALAAPPGAHTYWITVITFRNGRLVSEKGPSKGSGAGTWAVDGGGPQYGSGIGLVRGTAGRSPRLEGCGYTAMGSQGTEGPVRAVFAPYQWRQGRWVALPAIEQDFATGSALPRHCGAWVVPGMGTLPTDLPAEIASGSGARVQAQAGGRSRAGTEVNTEVTRGVEPRPPATTTPARRSTRCSRADGGPTAVDLAEDGVGTARTERPATMACPSVRSPVTRTRSAPPWFSGSGGRVASEGFLLLANTASAARAVDYGAWSLLTGRSWKRSVPAARNGTPAVQMTSTGSTVLALESTTTVDPDGVDPDSTVKIVRAFDLRTGKPIWSVPVQNTVTAVGGSGASGGTTFLMYLGKDTACPYSVATGQPTSGCITGGGLTFWPVLGPDTMLFPVPFGVLAYGAVDGRLIWEYTGLSPSVPAQVGDGWVVMASPAGGLSTGVSTYGQDIKSLATGQTLLGEINGTVVYDRFNARVAVGTTIYDTGTWKPTLQLQGSDAPRSLTGVCAGRAWDSSGNVRDAATGQVLGKGTAPSVCLSATQAAFFVSGSRLRFRITDYR